MYGGDWGKALVFLGWVALAGSLAILAWLVFGAIWVVTHLRLHLVVQ